MRRAVVERSTTETQVRIELELDGTGRFTNRTGVRFLDHMLDLVARHGREEFLVLCPFTTADEGLELAQRLRQAVSETAVPLPAGAVVPGISVGIAGCRPDAVRAIEVIQTAAEALQQALQMPLAERRDRHGSMVEALRRNDIGAWHGRFLDSLREAAQMRRRGAAH